jgi:hypothetical protein
MWKLFVLLLTFVDAKLVENCYTAVDTFVSNLPSKMNDKELSIVRNELLPFYVRECPDFLELDDYEALLRKEIKKRSLVQAEI